MRFHKVPHKGSIVKSSGSIRFHIKVPFLKVQVPQGSTERFHSEKFRFHNVPYKGSTVSCLGPKSFSLGFSGVSSLAPIARGFRRLSLHQHWKQVALWHQSLLVAPTGIWWHCGCSFKDLMADELGNEIRILLGDMNGMSKPPSWNAFAKIYDIKGGSLYCSLLDTALVPYERLYDFKLDFEDPSSSACAAFTSETSPPSLGRCLDTRSLCQASNAETSCWHMGKRQDVCDRPCNGQWRFGGRVAHTYVAIGSWIQTLLPPWLTTLPSTPKLDT